MKLTTNEEKVWKKIKKFPQGVKARQLIRELAMSKTTLYDALNRLETNNLAFRGEHSLWHPEQPLQTQNAQRSDRPRILSMFEARTERKKMEKKQESIAYDRETNRIRVENAILKERRKLGRSLSVDEEIALREKWTEHFEKITRKKHGLD